MEKKRLQDHYKNKENWLKWGPYLSERQWGTVREDYSPDGSAWEYFPHDHARSRVYRWGEDGIAGICDDLCNICFAPAFWNGKDPIIKERLFGLTNREGNHGEDVKELYYYLDSTPTHSYMKHLYKYSMDSFPYEKLVKENIKKSRFENEHELLDTGVFSGKRYFDIFTEYAKGTGEDILIKISAFNRSDEASFLSLIPTIWFRNLWSFGQMKEKPWMQLYRNDPFHSSLELWHPSLGTYYLYFERAEHKLFTENITNSERLYGIPNEHPFVKDAINDAIVSRDFDLFKNKNEGTKFSAVYESMVPGGGSVEIRLRLSKKRLSGDTLGKEFQDIFKLRKN